MIGNIQSWGPLFRISFDLAIHSNPPVKDHYSILSFKGNGGTNKCCNVGDRIPHFTYKPRAGQDNLLHFGSAIGSNGNSYTNINFNAEIDRLYSLVIEQKSVNNKVNFYCRYLHIEFV